MLNLVVRKVTGRP